MATTRIYILAEQLGVKSSAIVKKCQDEGLDIKNHMSVISVGLAATINEWFSEGDNVTTIETATKVDLKKVRVEKPPKPEKPAEKVEPQEGEQIAAETPGHQESETTDHAAPAEATAEPDTVDVTGEATAAAPVAAEETATVQAEQAPEPEKPEPIVPAGPMLEKPGPAKLTGPQVVRVEAPEPLRPIPARARSRGRQAGPVSEPLMQDRGEGKDLGTSPKDPKVVSSKKSRHRTGSRHGEEEGKGGKSKATGRWRQTDLEERKARLQAAGGEGMRMRPSRKIAARYRGEHQSITGRPVRATVNEPVTVKDLSAAIGAKTGEIMAKLMQQGVMATINQVISTDLAEFIAIEFGAELVVERRQTVESQIQQRFEQRPGNNLSRRPVVATMLGHVDHGKTSLLDKIRSAQVTASEAGGITQHIGAYQVSWGGKKITFLDTPGHEAFTAMRARGANMTDVVVLVVAADDGVMPQTVEAIHHAKAAGVAVIVALNKVDIAHGDFNRIYSQLSEQGLTPTDWSGDTEVVKTSAMTGEGIESLLEHIDYIAELSELKADDTIPATGWVVEARLSSQQGPVATILLKEGRLSQGDVVLAGRTFGKVKSMKNSFGKPVKTATSSMPVEITGLNEVPQAGDKFYCLSDLNEAKAAAEENKLKARELALTGRQKITLDNLFSQIEAGSVKELNIIIRADVQGSVDVLTEYLSELDTDQVKIKILHAATGGITEGDVLLAEASNAVIIGFNVTADERAGKLAESNGVEIRNYDVIYRVSEDLRQSMEGMLEPEESETTLGRATIRTTFKVSRLGTIAGCYVTDGLVAKNARARLIRNNVVIRPNLVIDSLKHFKDDVKQVKAGFECGIKLVKFDDVKVDDVLEFYKIEKVARKL